MAIREPNGLNHDLMKQWISADFGSKIMVTATKASSINELMNNRETPYGTMLAIETAIKARRVLIGFQRQCAKKDLRREVSPSPQVEISCMETISEFMIELEETMPFAWIHLGHGEIDGQASLSNGEAHGEWVPITEISNKISSSRGRGAMMFCILPTCYSFQSGEVLINNKRIMAIHATADDEVTDGQDQLLDMQKWNSDLIFEYFSDYLEES